MYMCSNLVDRDQGPQQNKDPDDSTLYTHHDWKDDTDLWDYFEDAQQ